MNLILCIFLIAASIFVFFTLCAFGLQAARAALPTYEEPTTTYSYQLDHRTDDIQQCVANQTSARDNPLQQVWIINVTSGRAVFRASEKADS